MNGPGPPLAAGVEIPGCPGLNRSVLALVRSRQGEHGLAPCAMPGVTANPRETGPPAHPMQETAPVRDVDTQD